MVYTTTKFGPALRELEKRLDQLNAAGIGKDHAAYIAVERRISDLADKLIKRPENVSGASVPGTGVDNPGRFSFAKLIWAISRNDWSSAGYEREVCMAATRTKDASLGSDTTLGNLVPTQVAEEIIPLVRSKMILDQIGVDMMPGVGGGFEQVRETGEGTGYWVGENSAITASDQETDIIRWRPHKAGAITKISNTLLRAGADRAETFVRNSIATTLSRLIQRAFFNGAGASGEPLGIFNISGILSETSVGAITFQKLQEMIEDIEANNTDQLGSMWWIGNPRVKGAIHQLSRTDGYGYTTSGATNVAPANPLFFPGAPTTGLPATVLSIPFASTTDLVLDTGAGTGELALGIFSQAVLMEWGGLEFMSTKEAGNAFEKDQTWVRVIREVDVNIKQTKALNVAFDVTY